MAIIALISCTKSKKSNRCPAKEMYAAGSPWFSAAHSLSSLIADEVFILSARHGLLPEDAVIDPYNETLADKNLREREQWADRVVADLASSADLAECFLQVLFPHFCKTHFLFPDWGILVIAGQAMWVI